MNCPKNICIKQRCELDKSKKKYSEEQNVSLCAYSIHIGKSFSYVEWIMDYGASNKMTGIASLFSSYDTNMNTSHNFQLVMVNIFYY